MEPHTDSSRMTDYVDQLAQIEHASTDELRRIEAAYHEIQRRDGAALWHAHNWRRLALTLLAAVLVLVSVVVYQARRASQVQAFVQVVQMTEEKRLVQIGVPMDLLAYTPEDGAWMDLASQWVIKRRWKGDEESMKRTRNEWQWLYAHTCGLAAHDLKRAEETEQPFKARGQRASVEVKTITKTTTPGSYQVLWHEVVADKGQSTIKAQDFIGTFTVGRLRPKTMAEALENRLGLCVTGFDMAPKVGS
jgi:type IV secretory pathway TrbF-like protein